MESRIETFDDDRELCGPDGMATQESCHIDQKHQPKRGDVERDRIHSARKSPRLLEACVRRQKHLQPQIRNALILRREILRI